MNTHIAETTDASHAEFSQLLDAYAHKDLLRFITCGSVDDGKSTLIGRLMLDAGAIYDDQIMALHKDSAKHGTTGEEIDTALLLDGLEDERQQGITIDVAYRYFATPKRKFIIADTPGHEQFTRNMATGASTADLAIILVDASKGILTQTKRHAFIVSLLGIKHIILAVNKMDRVDYRQDVFDEICTAFSRFADKLDVPDIRFIPVSALRGDNVAEPSANTLWYADGSLLHVLESIYVGADRNLKDLRFPVQWVNRPDADFRGFSGTIVSGTVRQGDEVLVLPSRKKSRVRGIVTMDGELAQAESPLSVTLTLEDEIDVTRGDMIVRPANLPHMGREAEAMLVWMSERPSSPNKQYWFKCSHGRTSGEIESIRYSIDVNTLHRQASAALQLNEIGRCRMRTHDPIAFDSYRRNRHTGSFILVDRITHETVAAGMFLDHETDGDGSVQLQASPDDALPRRAVSLVAVDERTKKYGHQPATVLLTGLCGAGKTTLALKLERRLFDQGRIAVVLDAENMRLGLARDLGYSAEECSENMRRAAEVAKLINDAGQICVAAFVGPQEATRVKFREIVGEDRFLHVHLSTPSDVCRGRDSSGHYAAAERGEIRSFPGVGFEYESPSAPDVLLANTHSDELAENVEQILRLLHQRGVV